MDTLKMCILVLFHPREAFYLIKRNREIIKLYQFALIYIVMQLIKLISIYFENFTISKVTPSGANLALEIAVVFVPLFAWIICSFGVTTIWSGEATLSETFGITMLSLIPYIALKPLLILFSNVLSIGEKGIYEALNLFLLLWVLFLMLLALKDANNLSFSKLITISLVSIIAMVILCAVIFMFLALGIQMVTFVTDVIKETKYL